MQRRVLRDNYFYKSHTEDGALWCETFDYGELLRMSEHAPSELTYTQQRVTLVEEWGDSEIITPLAREFPDHKTVNCWCWDEEYNDK